MSETFAALARVLPGEDSEIQTLIDARPEFAELVRRYESLETEAGKLLDEISSFLIEEEESAEDRRIV